MFDEQNAHTDDPRLDAGGKPSDPAIASADDPFDGAQHDPAPSGEPPAEPESAASPPDSGPPTDLPLQDEAVASGETKPVEPPAEDEVTALPEAAATSPPVEAEASVEPGDETAEEPPQQAAGAAMDDDESIEAPVSEPAAAGEPDEPDAEPLVESRKEQEPVDEELDEGDEAELETEEVAAAVESGETEDEDLSMDWYILKVQSNREDSIREGLRRRIAVEGMDRFFGDIIVPTEKVTEFKNGKKRVVSRKLYPGYIVVHMVINDDTWFLVRDTPGIGDFTGAAGTPIPMQSHEVARLLQKQEEKTEEAPKLSISFNVGDRIKINEGTFQNFEGEVDVIDEANGRVTVMINIFGRSTPVELEYWQIESV